MTAHEAIEKRQAELYLQVTQVTGREPTGELTGIDGQPVYQWAGGLNKKQRAALRNLGYSPRYWKVLPRGIAFGWH